MNVQTFFGGTIGSVTHLVHIARLLGGVRSHLLSSLGKSLYQRAPRCSRSCSASRYRLSLILQPRHASAPSPSATGYEAAVHHLPGLRLPSLTQQSRVTRAVVDHSLAEPCCAQTHSCGVVVAVLSYYSSRRSRFLALRRRVAVGRTLAKGALAQGGTELRGHTAWLGACRVEPCARDAGGAASSEKLRELLMFGGCVRDDGGAPAESSWGAARSAARCRAAIWRQPA